MSPVYKLSANSVKNGRTVYGSMLAGNPPYDSAPVNPVQTNLFAWFSADRPADFTYSSGTSVSQWNDRSGNARHITQATSTNQPTRNGTMNGRSTVVFDTTDRLSFASTQDMGENYSIFAVFDTPSITASAGGGVIAQAGGSSGLYLQFGAGTGGLTNERMMWLNNSTARGVGETATDISDGDHQFTWILTSKTSSAYWFDRVSKSLSVSTNGNFISSEWPRYIDSIGQTSSSLDSEVAEIIIYNTALNTSDRESVENYLKDKWGLA